DEVVDYDETFASALIYITAESPFFDAELGGVPSWVGMEYMAQTIGIWAGHQQLINNKPVQAGFLLGCRSYDCNSAVFPAGCTLQLSAKPVYLDDIGIGAFDCAINSENIVGANNIHASAQIKAFRPQDPKDFVRPFSTVKSISPDTGTSA
ncbi:MAG TPA: hypothetical protein PK031_10130, partial [Pseudomonadales bacterium]|nr:hypothetical protein [Pseudomonadales bacterium]